MMRQLICAAALWIVSSTAFAEVISYAIYSLPLVWGDKTLVAEGRRSYSHNELQVSELEVPTGSEPAVRMWSKTLSVANGFEIGATVFLERRTDGFGLWIRKNGGGFSWEWFTRQKDDTFRKLQGPGRLKVRFKDVDGLNELAEVEFLDDVTMRLNALSFIPFRNKDTDHLIVRKGSVLWFAP
jgi:hypothetical protein